MVEVVGKPQRIREKLQKKNKNTVTSTCLISAKNLLEASHKHF